MPSSSTVAADCKSSHTLTAHMTHLLAVSTHDVPETTSAAAPPAAAAATSLSHDIAFRTLPSHMPRYVAHVADWLIRAITCQVASFPTVVACLLIRTVSCNVPLLVAVVTQPQVARRSGAFSGNMSSLTTCVADAFIRTVAGRVARLTAVPT